MSVVNGNVSAIWHARILALRNRGVLAIVHMYDDSPGGAVAATIVVFADLVANNAAANSADNGSRRSAVTLANRATQHATGNSANHSTQGTAIAITSAALDIDLIHLLHNTTVLAWVSVAGTLLVTAVLRRGATSQRDAGCHRQAD